MKVLRWHVDTQLVTPEQQQSELRFPSVTGGHLTEQMQDHYSTVRGPEQRTGIARAGIEPATSSV